MLALLEASEFNINEKFMQNLIAFAFKKLYNILRTQTIYNFYCKLIIIKIV